jgi:hypothetical protein
MDEAAERRRVPVAAMLAIAGGVLLVIGSFLTWAKVSGGGTSGSATGMDGSDGWVTLVAGAIVLAVGLAFAAGKGRRKVAVLAICAALLGGGLGLYDALTAKDRVLDEVAGTLADQFGATAQEVRVLLDAAVEAGELGISLGIGLLMVIAGGALALVGGVMRVASRPEVAVMPPASGSATPDVSAVGPDAPPMPPAGPWAGPPE